MAKVICDMFDCKHISKRPMRSYVKKSGAKCYGCTLDVISVSKIVDPDGYVIVAAGKENMSQCINYDPIEEDE